MQDRIWVTRDGQRLLVSNMTTSHIVNALRMIDRHGNTWRADYRERLEIELVARGVR